MTETQIAQIREVRWKARTDLLWLCNHILGYRDVNKNVHGTFIDRLYQFPKPTEQQKAEHDQWIPDKAHPLGGYWNYTPLLIDHNRTPARLPDPISMPGKRRGLYLDSRGFLKSTVNLKAHTIQWLLNYPDVSIIIFQGKAEKAEDAFLEIKEFFWTKAKLMRMYFPEYCVPIETKQWGNASEFTLPCRHQDYNTQNTSVKALSLGESTAGRHVEVIKFSDVVDEKNSKTDAGCQSVIYDFDIADNILVSPSYWIDVEGTRYAPSDLYGVIIDREKKAQTIPEAYEYQKKIYRYREDAVKAAEQNGDSSSRVFTLRNVYVPDDAKRRWSVYINAGAVLNRANPTFDYDDMESPLFMMEGKDVPIVSRWERRHPAAVMWEKFNDTTGNPSRKFVFCCQQLNNPILAMEDMNPFPLELFSQRLLSKRIFDQRIRKAYYDIAVDTARVAAQRNDFNVISVACVDEGGRRYIVEMWVNKGTDEETVDELFRLHKLYTPMRVLYENEPHMRGLMTWITRKMQMENYYINFVQLKRGTGLPKKDRIKSTLGPRYREGDIRFVCPEGPDGDPEMTPAIRHVYEEMRLFPKWHDDALDTLSDLFHENEWHGRIKAKPTFSEVQTIRWRKFFGLDGEEAAAPMADYYRITGGF